MKRTIQNQKSKPAQAEGPGAKKPEKGAEPVFSAQVEAVGPQMGEHRVSKTERAALRKARREKARGSDYSPALRVSYALAVNDESAHGSQAAADALDRMATASGRAFCATWTSNGGRFLTPSQTEEMACIFRAEFAAAAVRSGLVPPDIGSLFVVRHGNVLPFRALLIWRRALKAGMKRCRSSLWGKGGEGFVFLSLEALETSKALEQAGLNDSCASVSSARPADVAATLRGLSADAALGWAEPGAESTGTRARRRVRRLVGAWGDYLRAFWMLSGSRSWRYGMAGDLRLLRIAAQVATGAGSVELADWHGDGEAASDSLRDGLRKLRKHVAAGRLLCHGQTALAASGVLELARTVRLAPVTTPAAEVRTGDLVSSSQ
jgi:hypothetical protein